jgi:hypothetical protein
MKVISDDDFTKLKEAVIAAFPPKVSQPEPLLRMLAELSDLHARKVLTDKEFEQLKAAVVAALPARLPQPGAR